MTDLTRCAAVILLDILKWNDKCWFLKWRSEVAVIAVGKKGKTSCQINIESITGHLFIIPNFPPPFPQKWIKQ